jgi:hypothetical protein
MGLKQVIPRNNYNMPTSTIIVHNQGMIYIWHELAGSFPQTGDRCEDKMADGHMVIVWLTSCFQLLLPLITRKF